MHNLTCLWCSKLAHPGQIVTFVLIFYLYLYNLLGNETIPERRGDPPGRSTSSSTK